MKKRHYFPVIAFLMSLIVLNLLVVTRPVQATPEKIDENGDWDTSTPGEQGMDSGILDELKTYITKNYPDMFSMVIARNGFLVEEAYFGSSATTKRNIYSCTKSFTSALIGIAIHEGFIENINESVLGFFPDYNFTNTNDRKKNMTLYHLLTMTTGLKWDEADYSDSQNPLYLMWDSTDWVQYVLDLEMVNAPGFTFRYNSGASHVLSAIINRTTGMSTLEYAESRLFGPLGISDYYWPVDPQGVNKGGEGLELTPRSLSKLGQLYLDNGSWKEQQIVPKEWVLQSTQSTLISPTNNSYGYGYQWWLHPGGDIFSAWGYAHQRVIVVPEYQVVATFTSAMPRVSGDPAANLVNTWVLPSIFIHEDYKKPTESTDSSVTFYTFIIPILLILVVQRKNQRKD